MLQKWVFNVKSEPIWASGVSDFKTEPNLTQLKQMEVMGKTGRGWKRQNAGKFQPRSHDSASAEALLIIPEGFWEFQIWDDSES